MDPLAFGTYPETMKSILGNRLPDFTDEQAENLRHSIDFVGLNVVSAAYVTNTSIEEGTGYFEDMCVEVTGADA
jgi:beta-glucosidase/6-phospho-beta-glucosidase/beta-galactosidase